MSFFTRSVLDADPTVTLLPLTNEAIGSALDSLGCSYGVDGDGDIGGRWDRHLFYFFRLGPDDRIFQVRARYDADLTVDDRAAALELVHEWNTRTIWPKAYVLDRDGELAIYGEVSTDLAAGATTAQLRYLITSSIGTTLDLFEQLDGKFVAAATAAKERAAAREQSE